MYANIRHDATIQTTRPIIESEWISDVVHEQEFVETISSNLRGATDLNNIHTILEQAFNVSPAYSTELGKLVLEKMRTIQMTGIKNK